MRPVLFDFQDPPSDLSPPGSLDGRVLVKLETCFIVSGGRPVREWRRASLGVVGFFTACSAWFSVFGTEGWVSFGRDWRQREWCFQQVWGASSSDLGRFETKGLTIICPNILSTCS